MPDLIRIVTRTGPPILATADEILRVLVESDSYEKRPARLLRVGDLIQCRGRIEAIAPVGGAA